jgi:hypothetical protein
MQNLQEDYENAVKILQIADHMAYITYPIINEKRLLLKVIEEIHKCLNLIITIAIKLENQKNKNMIISTNPELNFQTFLNLSKKYEISEKAIQLTSEIFQLYQKHKQSSMEFPKQNKIIILSDNLTVEFLEINKIKEYLTIAKEILLKVGKFINEP